MGFVMPAKEQDGFIFEGELSDFVNRKPIATLHVIQYPNGKFGYVGKVPVEIGYIDPTPKQLEDAQFGERFGPKQRRFDTQEDAIKYAEDRGYEVANKPKNHDESWRASIESAKSYEDIEKIFSQIFSFAVSRKNPEPISPLAIEYVTRDLFKKKSLKAAVRAFMKKFNGRDNMMFLGKVQVTEEGLYLAVLDNKAEYAIKSAERALPGRGSYALDATASYFNINKDELARAIAKKLKGSDGNGILADYPELSSVVLESSVIDREAHKAATSPKNDLPEPSQAQKEAGNYVKGHVIIRGLEVVIENPAGSERSGVDKDGKKWTSKIYHHYGYLKNTVGRDKDHLDVFLGPDPKGAEAVFVVNQKDPKTGGFDEHKIMWGWSSKEDAGKAYLKNYEKGWKGMKSIVAMPFDEFKKWIRSGDTTKEVKNHFVGESATVNQDLTVQNEGGQWVGVDLDGTLAEYDGEWKGKDHIGEPIPLMMDVIKEHIANGETVKIFTARASDPEAIPPIKAWLEKNGLGDLEVTNVKDHGMSKLYDDRAAKVIRNIGVVLEAAADYDWRAAIEVATSFEDIKTVFARVFPVVVAVQKNEPWQITRAEYRDSHPEILSDAQAYAMHSAEVFKAIEDGKDVSPGIVKEYPDIIDTIYKNLISYIKNYPDILFENAGLPRKSRAEIRTFLGQIKPVEVKALKLGDHDKYIEVLRAMVERLFPEGSTYTFRKSDDGSETDYEHFLKDRSRKAYLHTIGNTVKTPDIHLEFTEGDRDKEYFIKKYFDAEIQRDIWDVVVIHNKEIRTKFSRKGRDAQRYVEGQILKERPDREASRSGTPDGISENASTHRSYE